MQIAKVPIGVFDELEKIGHWFLWSEIGVDKMMRMVGWNKVYRAKGEGWLGLSGLAYTNLVFLAQLCWHFLKESGKFRMRVLRQKYGDFKENHYESKFGGVLSYVWKGMLAGFEGLNKGLVRDVRDRQTAPFGMISGLVKSGYWMS